MKRIAAMFWLIVLTVTINRAQTPNDGRDQYLAWKNHVSTTLQDFGHLYTFRIGIALTKTDKTHAHILLAVAGRTPNYYFTLQPVQTQFLDTDVEQDKTGKSKEWGAGQDTSVPRLGYLLDFDETLEFEENTTAVLVTIKPVPNKGQPVETTLLKMIVPLANKWHFEEKDIFVPINQPD
jgi:hypothetical protein